MCRIINWKTKSKEPGLTEDFIRDHYAEVDLELISFYQTLGEDFIIEFQDQVDWFCISYSQKLSKDFILEFQDRLDLDMLLEDQDLVLDPDTREYLKLLNC